MGYWFILWFGLALACNAPIGPAAPLTPTASLPATVTVTMPIEPTAEAPATAPFLTPAGDPSATALPTALSTRPTQAPTLAPTVTARASSTRPPAAPTRTPAVTIGPLAFTYQITWRLDPQSSAQAIAHVTITATGGNGVYTYYRDDLPVAGPDFEYKWASCRANPGSLRVDSGDGQTLRLNYYENPPCPTPPPP
ncbi:MAG: hypothetical protein AB1791_11245 [Chloroflexota bacterium]